MTRTSNAPIIHGIKATLIVVALAFAFAATTSTAWASQEDGLENSWRYSDGELIGASDSDGAFDVGEVSGLTAQSTSPDLVKFGIDVSHHQKTIDWAQAKSRVRYAIVRCGWGHNTSAQDDSQWANNIRGVRQNDIPFGVYIYSYATNATEARDEAQHVLRQLREQGITYEELSLPIYLDMEDNTTNGLSRSTYAQIVDAFREELQSNGYWEVGVYASCSWWADNLSEIDMGSDWMWIARYYSKDYYTPGQNGYSTTPFGGKFSSLASNGCGIWQYSSMAQLPGIPGNTTDVNVADLNMRFLQGNYASGTMFRLYNPNSGEHFYTASQHEAEFLTLAGWNWEDKGWVAPTSGDAVYRLYNPNAGDHHYTLSAEEKNHLVSLGWRYEGVGWYSAGESGVPLYRQYNPNAKSGAHNFTTSTTERDMLVRLGWHDEGVAWYAKAK